MLASGRVGTLLPSMVTLPLLKRTPSLPDKAAPSYLIGLQKYIPLNSKFDV